MAINRRDLHRAWRRDRRGTHRRRRRRSGSRADRHPDQVGSHRRRRGDRRRRHRHSRGDRRARSRLVGDPGRGAAACRRPCARQRRQRAARRRHQRAEEIRHRGFARPRVQGSHRLVGGAAQRRARLSLQRSRDHPRLRRQQRRHLRVARGARRRVRRQGAGSARRFICRQLGDAHHARGADGLAADPDRQAGDRGAAHDHVDRQRADAAARRRRAARPACSICSSTR